MSHYVRKIGPKAWIACSLALWMIALVGVRASAPAAPQTPVDPWEELPTGGESFPDTDTGPGEASSADAGSGAGNRHGRRGHVPHLSRRQAAGIRGHSALGEDRRADAGGQAEL